MAEDTGTGSGGSAGSEGGDPKVVEGGNPQVADLEKQILSLTAKIAEKDNALKSVTAESIERKNKLKAYEKVKKTNQQVSDGEPDLKSEFEKRFKSAAEKHAEELNSATETIKSLTATVRSDRIHSNIITIAAKYNAIRPDEIAQLLSNDIELDKDLKPYVKDKVNGGVKLDGGIPITVDAHIQEFLRQRPNHVKSTNVPGAGSGQGGNKALTNAQIGNLTPEQYALERKKLGFKK
jgi:hypothetical protein